MDLFLSSCPPVARPLIRILPREKTKRVRGGGVGEAHYSKWTLWVRFTAGSIKVIVCACSCVWVCVGVHVYSPVGNGNDRSTCALGCSTVGLTACVCSHLLQVGKCCKWVALLSTNCYQKEGSEKRIFCGISLEGVFPNAL